MQQVLVVQEYSKQLKKGIFAIGVDSVNYVLPGTILTSVVKRVDISVYDTIKDVFKWTIEQIVNFYGIKKIVVELTVV